MVTHVQQELAAIRLGHWIDLELGRQCNRIGVPFKDALMSPVGPVEFLRLMRQWHVEANA